MSTPSNDESCDLLAEKLRRGERFCHAKFGDGEIEVMHGIAKWQVTASGERHWEDREAQRKHVEWRWKALKRAAFMSDRVYLADWMTCGDPQGLRDTWMDMMRGTRFYSVSYEALLIHRLSPALRSFYCTLRSIDQTKLLVTSSVNRGMAAMLNAQWLPIPEPEKYHARSDVIAHGISKQIAHIYPSVLLLAGGGIAASAQAYLLEWGFSGTQISLGSALDPLFRGRTRSGQVDPAKAREYFKELL